ncbi:MAG: InlB B-repeat-containing protein [Treponema sp.]|jgi:uncharacterized repeat protein (TIGR02543 family)|nr:InlB B-repeat-containing protein [Treponema sp.]
MKSKLFFMGMLTLALTFGMTLTACDSSDETIAIYTVSYDVNGGSGTAPSSQTSASGSSVTLASGSGLSKSGYTFGGWNTNSSGTGTTYAARDSYSVTANTTLYAKWTVNTYTVTYNVNSGSGTTPSSQTAASGSSVMLASGSGLSKSGYTFGGWNTNSSGTGTTYAADSSYSVTANTTLYAKWTVNTATTYTVTYSVNGGSGTAPSSQTAAVGSSVTLASGSGLTKSGYTFGGWNTNSSGTGTTYAARESYSVTANTTLYAKWEPAGNDSIKITLENNGEYGWQKTYQESSLLKGGRIIVGNTYTITYSFVSNVPMDYLQMVFVDNSEASGYSWNVLSEYQKAKENVPANTTMSGTVTLAASKTATDATSSANMLVLQTGTGTAQQPTLTFTELTLTVENGGDEEATTYTVSYNVNGGSGTAPSSQTAASGSSVTLASGSGLSKSGYTFGGWNTNSSGTGTTYTAGSSYSVTADTTLYAKWTALPTYTVKYSVNNGSGTAPSSQSTTSGSSITLASGGGLTRSGYTFEGWNTNSSGTGTTYVANSSYTVTANITLYAKWTAIPKPSTPVISDITLISETSKNGLRVSWGNVTNATSYEVSRASTKTGTFKVLSTVTSIYYDDTTALIDAEGQQYWYRIVAINSTVRSNISTAKGVKVPGFGWYMYTPQKAAGKTVYKAEAICDDDGWYTLTANRSSTSGTEEKTYHPVLHGTHVFQFNYNPSSSANGWVDGANSPKTYTISNTLPYCYLFELNVVDGSIRRVLNMFME